MIVNVLCKTPPEKFFKWADKKGTPFADFNIVSRDDIAVEGDKIVFLSFDLFVRFVRRVDINATVYLFCPFHQIVQYSTNVNFLDVKPNGFEFAKKRRIYVPKVLTQFEFERGATYIQLLEEHVEKGSILTHFMTFIYTLDSKHQQKPVTYTVCCWMRTKDSWETLVEELKALDSPIKQKHIETLEEIMSLPIAKKIRKALQKVTTMESVPKIALKHCVDPYELRYILGKSNYVEKIIDEDVMTR